jgi:hypothetical protein
MISAALRKWVAFGSGVGISIEGPRGSEWLQVVAIRVRPTGAKQTASFIVEDFRNRPAAEWGSEYSAGLAKARMQQTAATVLLPRHEVILRHLSLPGVSDKDLDAAVTFQLDGLHPYGEGDVMASWARLEGSDSVAVAIAKRERVDAYATLFQEAGIKLAGFTCSGPAIFSALRVFGQKPSGVVFAMEPSAGGVEIYGESAARPLLSAAFDFGPEESADRVIARSAAELRLENAPEPVGLAELMRTDQPRAFAAALTSACRMSSVGVNLLPAELREVRSPWQWVPTLALGALVLIGALVVALFPRYQNGSYLESLNSEIAKVQPEAIKASALDKEIEASRARTLLLDNLRKHGKSDLDVLGNMTSLLAPPVWLKTLEMTPKDVSVSGEADQATPLLKQIDGSPLFEGSEFTSPPSRVANVENFSIRTKRSAQERAK